MDALSQDQKNLVDWLFEPNHDYSRAKQELRAVFADINQKSTKGVTISPDVVFYCDLKRFYKRQTGEGWVWVDGEITHPDAPPNTAMAIVRDEDGETYDPTEQCSHIGMRPPGNKVTNMFVINMSGNAQVIICPWLLEYADKKGWNERYSWQTWGVGKAARFINLKQFVSNWFYSPVDLVFAFEKMILHELTHANAFKFRRTIDVGGWDGYGWKNCRKLSHIESNKNSDNQDDWVRGGYDNADSYALFGSCLYALEKGYRFTEDGDVDTSGVQEGST
ncbi:hypothetical protein CC78DRAFT_605099 [Lojkania enalia]|uniref:Rieske domain-containing protein n=1 Tax=Lojkania enalia TaxID=147567 RepID=A0A9P4N585_9PLEO|nr:hypothetical protein CC78DRAFT_605099 [Didymosphaeria enalia]